MCGITCHIPDVFLAPNDTILNPTCYLHPGLPFFAPEVLVFAGGSVKGPGEFSNFCILEDVEGCNVLR